MVKLVCCNLPILRHFYSPWLTVPNGSFLFLGLSGKKKKNSFWACDTILRPLMSEIMIVLNWSSLPRNETSLSALFWGLFNDFFLPPLSSSDMVHWGELGVWSGKLLNNKKALLSSVEGKGSILHCSHQTQAVPLLWSRGNFLSPLSH